MSLLHVCAAMRKQVQGISEIHSASGSVLSQPLPHPQGAFGNVWRHFSVVTTGTGVLLTPNRGQDAARQSVVMHGKSPHSPPYPFTKNYEAQNANGVEVEKLWVKP